MSFKEINKIVGNADLYLIDQILKGRFSEGALILDLGCGEGRNLSYFLQNQYQVLGIDHDPMAIKLAQLWAKKLQPDRNRYQFIPAEIQELNEYVRPNSIDVALAINVLQWLPDYSTLKKVWDDLTVSLKAGGLLIVRITLGAGSENQNKAGSYKPEKDEMLKLVGNSNFQHLEPPLYLFREHLSAELVLILEKQT